MKLRLKWCSNLEHRAAISTHFVLQKRWSWASKDSLQQAIKVLEKRSKLKADIGWSGLRLSKQPLGSVRGTRNETAKQPILLAKQHDIVIGTSQPTKINHFILSSVLDRRGIGARLFFLLSEVLRLKFQVSVTCAQTYILCLATNATGMGSSLHSWEIVTVRVKLTLSLRLSSLLQARPRLTCEGSFTAFIRHDQSGISLA